MKELKRKAAISALNHLNQHRIIGVGTGSTVQLFIEELAKMRDRIDAAVASSTTTEMQLRAAGIPVMDLNEFTQLPLYIDGADEVNFNGEMIKGGGGALTREKIIASASEQFICIVDNSKLVQTLGAFPIAVEVLPIARSFVTRQLEQLGARAEHRNHFVTDNGNVILDVFDLNCTAHPDLENTINQIPGVVENGLFLKRKANHVIVASNQGINEFKL